jgi:hypothetical protein
MTSPKSEGSTGTLKDDTTMDEEISYTPTSPNLHSSRPRYPRFVASSPPEVVYSPSSLSGSHWSSPRHEVAVRPYTATPFSASSPSYSPTGYHTSSPRCAAISPSFSPTSPSFANSSPHYAPTPGFAASNPKQKTLPPDTVLSAIRCAPINTSSKDAFRKDARMFSLTEDRPETWPNITKQQENNVRNSIKAISWKENAAAKLLLVIVWAIVFKSSGDDHSDFWITVEEAAYKELFELPASPATYLVWIQNVKLPNKGNLKDWVNKDGEAFFVVSKTGGAGGIGDIEGLGLISTVDGYLPILTFTLI